ncbi:MAG: hypothetical protein LLG01_18500 [Planctomycetaceae bacterium]|nr:hypothetical protein [Planctomycetaceae bacterium]
MSEKSLSGLTSSASDTATWATRLLPRRRMWMLAPAALVVGLAGWLLLPGQDAQQESLGPLTKVTGGPMVISVTQAAEIQPASRKVIANELRWPVVIKEVVPEGTRVVEGQTIVLFECKDLTDDVDTRRLEVAAAETNYISAEETLKLCLKETANTVRTAQQAVEDAKEDLQRYIEGDWPIAKAKAESDIQIAQRDLTLAQTKMDFKLKVNADPTLKSPYSSNEIEADRLGLEKLKLSLQQAIWARDILLKFDYPRQKRTFQTKVADADLALVKAQVESRTKRMVAESQTMTAKSSLAMRKSRLREREDAMKDLIVKADRPGLVVYDSGNPRNPVTVAVGEEIRPRQQIMIIPDMSSLQVETKVFESIISEVHPGIEALISPGTELGKAPIAGHVTHVAPLPDSQWGWGSGGAKVFNVVIAFDNLPGNLKPGTRAQVELVLARLDDVLSAPISAVYTIPGKDGRFVRRVRNGQVEQVAIETGRMNDKRVVIAKGLQEGDEVLLTRPEDIADQDAMTQPASRPHRAQSRPAQPPRQAQSRPAGANHDRTGAGKTP